MVGNVSNYDELDIIRVFLRIDGKMPRKQLCDDTQLGEGSIKAILNLLKGKGLISSTRKGHFLSKKGIELRNEISRMISGIKKIRLDIFKGFHGAALVIKDIRTPITYKQRDIAIRTGAEAALLFKFRDRLFLPQCEQGLIDTKKMDGLFDYKNGDVLAVVFARNDEVIEKALLNVAMGLDRDILASFKKLTNQ